MEFSRQYLTRLAQESNFIKDTLEKVLRLSEILKFINSDVVFKDKLALKGGTAINLTAVELPRLSVDIDLDFAVNVSRNVLPEIKETFKKRLTDYMWQEGYSLADSRDHFALTSFLFNYINNAGNRDNIKVEINFLDRCHVLPLEKKKILTRGKFLYYFYDRKKLTSVALPEEQFDKLVEMYREYYNLERRENDYKTTFKKSASAKVIKKLI